MRLQRLLVTELACSCHCRSGAPAGLSAVCVAAWRSAFKHLLGVAHPRSLKANRRACDSAESLHPRFCALAHCYLQLYSSKRSEVILPLVGTSIRAALPHPITPQNPVLSPKTTLYAGIQPFLELPDACIYPHRLIQDRRPSPCPRQHSQGLHLLHLRASQAREGPRTGPETAPAPRHRCHSSPTHHSQAAWPGQRLAGDVLPA